MDTSLKAGPAAPTPAAAELPSYRTDDAWGYGIQVLARDWRNEPSIGDCRVLLKAGRGNLDFSHSMTPAEARELAVYLVDCANALDNPAQRVIVDEGEPETARHMCSECNVLTECPNGADAGIGHE